MANSGKYTPDLNLCMTDAPISSLLSICGGRLEVEQPSLPGSRHI
jgi:hypothetical protein